MVRISSNRKPAGLLQKEFKHFILCKVAKKKKKGGFCYFEVLLPSLLFQIGDLISEDHRASNLKGGGKLFWFAP